MSRHSARVRRLHGSRGNTRNCTARPAIPAPAGLREQPRTATTRLYGEVAERSTNPPGADWRERSESAGRGPWMGRATRTPGAGRSSTGRPAPGANSPDGNNQSIRRGGRAVEGARLESVCTSQAYRGFESLPLRHMNKKPRHRRGFLFVRCRDIGTNPTGSTNRQESRFGRRPTGGAPQGRGPWMARVNPSQSVSP